MSNKANKERDNKKETAANKKKVLTFDDVADTQELDEIKGRQTPTVELDEPVTIDADMKELSEHLNISITMEDDKDSVMVDTLNKNGKVNELDAQAYMLLKLDDAFPNFAQEFYERVLKGEKITKKTLRNILVDRVIAAVKTNPEESKIVEETGGFKVWKTWLKDVFDLESFKDKYDKLLDSLLQYDEDEIKAFLELNKEKTSKRESDKVFLVSGMKETEIASEVTPEVTETPEEPKAEEEPEVEEKKEPNRVEARTTAVSGAELMWGMFAAPKPIGSIQSRLDAKDAKEEEEKVS